MSAPKFGARGPGNGSPGDLIVHNLAHTSRLFGFLAATLGAAAWVGRGARFLLVGTGPAGWVALGASIVVEWVASEAIEYVAFKIGEQIRFEGVDGIREGSPNVNTNLRPSARGKNGTKLGDRLNCHEKRLEGGSEWVSINSRPAARLHDWTEHSAKIGSASEDTLMGGPTVAFTNTSQVQDALKVLFILRGIGDRAVELGGMAALGEAARQGTNLSLDALWDQVKPNYGTSGG